MSMIFVVIGLFLALLGQIIEEWAAERLRGLGHNDNNKTPNLKEDRGFVVPLAGLAPLAARPAKRLSIVCFAVKVGVV